MRFGCAETGDIEDPPTAAGEDAGPSGTPAGHTGGAADGRNGWVEVIRSIGWYGSQTSPAPRRRLSSSRPTCALSRRPNTVSSS